MVCRSRVPPRHPSTARGDLSSGRDRRTRQQQVCFFLEQPVVFHTGAHHELRTSAERCDGKAFRKTRVDWSCSSDAMSEWYTELRFELGARLDLPLPSVRLVDLEELNLRHCSL